MASEFNLREEILAISHHWPIPILIFIVGCVLGWGVSHIVPAPYRAQESLSVAYDGDTIYRNPDDYKNWYMEQLNTLTVSQPVLQETLLRLQQQDAYWKRFAADDLGSMFQVAWRNTGVWRFMVNANSAKHAEQAIQVWVEVFIEQYQQAYAAASEFAILDKQLSTINRNQIEIHLRIVELNEIKSALKSLRETDLSMSTDQPLNISLRWQLQSLVARAAGFNPAWKELLGQFPASDAPASKYVSWLALVSNSLDAELADLPAQAAKLDSDQAVFDQKYQQVAKDSLGLSISLIVTRMSNNPSKAVAVRSSSQAALVGGVIALIGVIIFWLARIKTRSRL